jgi:hypothetical protein
MGGAQKGLKSRLSTGTHGKRFLFKTRRRHWPALVLKVTVQTVLHRQPLNELQVNIELPFQSAGTTSAAL